MVTLAVEAGGLVKAARESFLLKVVKTLRVESFQLQMAQPLVPAGCVGGCEGKH